MCKCFIFLFSFLLFEEFIALIQTVYSYHSTITTERIFSGDYEYAQQMSQQKTLFGTSTGFMLMVLPQKRSGA